MNLAQFAMPWPEFFVVCGIAYTFVLIFDWIHFRK